MAFIKDFLATFKALSLVDFIFFIAIIVLIILIVSLIYFIKINKDEPIEEEKENDKQINLADIIPISLADIGADTSEDNNEMIDLESVTKALESRQAHPIEMTDYEAEQEERAIISYDELLAKNSNIQVNYELPTKEEDKEISIKKVDLGNLVTRIEEEPPKTIEVRLISYEKEEAFLDALKRLKEQIN